MAPATSTIGFPRIGPHRELKATLERYWKGAASADELRATQASVELAAWNAQRDAGVERIGADGTLYDQVLDAVYFLGATPQRFQKLGLMGLDLYFAMARGAEGAGALDMSKFMDTNYHYEVPELDAGWVPKPDFSMILDKVARCQAAVGKAAACPMVVGPLTFCALAKRLDGSSVGQALERVTPAYCQLLRELKALGVQEVQIHEPYLATSQAEALQAECTLAITALAAEGVPLNLVAVYDDIGSAYPWVVQLPVAVVSLDFLGVPGAAASNRTLELVATHGFPASKTLGAGIVDGRSVWADTGLAPALLSALVALGVAPSALRVQSSVSLQHLPLDLALEVQLPEHLKGRLAFAVQKLQEMGRVARAPLAEQGSVPAGSPAALQLVQDVCARFAARDTGLTVAGAQLARAQPYAQRRPQQIQTRPFPTTSIGSFPQTANIRRLRLQHKRGQLSDADYAQAIAAHIGFAIGMQEALDMDVLVHGEPERTDMVEYFGQELEGMLFTDNGWVQSYGSRYVRPPIIAGDVKFVEPITVTEFCVAQGLTSRPVKGMLTGPVTVLNWSFVRTDISRKSQCMQLALALREEVAALEAAGCRVIQVDEPALREGLPLKADRWAGYLEWAVDAFRGTCATAKPSTQIVTHLCYSDFADIMGAIDGMDADVLTIENSRSDDEMVRALAGAKYSRDIGPGVYDVHSPVVPSVRFIKDKIRSFVSTGILGGDARAIWVNPDCGLKTRGWAEVIPSLRNMVQAAAEMRAELVADKK